MGCLRSMLSTLSIGKKSKRDLSDTKPLSIDLGSDIARAILSDMARQNGRIGGRARLEKSTPRQRHFSARHAAKARWKRKTEADADNCPHGEHLSFNALRLVGFSKVIHLATEQDKIHSPLIGRRCQMPRTLDSVRCCKFVHRAPCARNQRMELRGATFRLPTYQRERAIAAR